MVPDPKQVKFGGVLYHLPADMPMEIFLRINKSAAVRDENGEPDQVRQIDLLADTIADLFLWEQEGQLANDELAEHKANVRQTLMRRGTKYGFSLIREIYRADDEADEARAEGESEDQVPEDEDLSGTRSSTTSPSPTTIPTVIRAEADS